MLVGIASCLGAGYVMLAVDIPRYFARFLGIGEGVRDAMKRRVPTNDWAVWKQEVLWISTCFTFGVWLSIGMSLVRF